MKQKDLAIIILIAFISIMISSVLANAIFNSSKKHNLKAPTVNVISSDFPQVQSESAYKPIFNSEALNPTQLIKIGTSQNTTPFNQAPTTQ